jgi:lysophospholipase L1-like esterase
MNLARSLMVARYPELRLRFLNRGVGGDTTRNLLARWQRDVLAEQPDWLSVMIGINDVWRAFGANVHEAVPQAEYEANLRELLERARDGGARLILMTPYMIEGNPQVAMRRQMDAFSGVVERLAGEYGAVLVHTQRAFDTVLEQLPSAALAVDQIHPGSEGHAVIALAWLRAVGFAL